MTLLSGNGGGAGGGREGAELGLEDDSMPRGKRHAGLKSGRTEI